MKPNTLLPLLILSASLAASAAVPLRWTVETSRATPAVFEAYQGETLAFEAALQSDGKPLEAPFNYALYWQTNGMGSAYWSAPCAPAAAATNVLFATWSPTNDVGARAYNCFIGAPGTIYHAAFQLRLRPSPGATPNALPLPQPVIDFDKVTVLNPPWSAAGGGRVLSVNGKDGEVVLSATDVNALPATYTPPRDETKRDLTNNVCASDSYGSMWEIVSSELYDINIADLEDQPKVESHNLVWRVKDTLNKALVSFNYEGASEVVLYGMGDLTSTDRMTVRLRRVAVSNETFVTESFVSNSVSDVEEKVDESLIYSYGVYQYMTGNTNAWFAGTNYVTTADGTTRTKFELEDGMDAATVPCSMALWEIRDGKKVVWDQRDWTVWFWNFKSAQMSNSLSAATAALSASVKANYMRRGWAKYTAVQGLDNPSTDTLWVDTPNVSLMAGHQWEKLVEVGGAGYYTLTGNGIELAPQEAESTFLTLKDFEGNACFTFRKTSSYLVYCECGTDIVSNYRDGQNRVVFHITTDVQPTAEFSTILDTASFVEQGEDGCPVNYEWTGSAGSWDCHFLLKPGIASASCFARFKVMREGENVIEHTVPIKITGGIVFEQNGQTLKCKPVAQGTSVGSTVNWVIAQ